ncbi:hypothetical protein D9757_000141 [Collybiopsis confluens]|uniref:Uncharacterized protein n=1 Tax=Collybiopsis confluens TaxID=2823264 RepID=A0A8H5MHD4_9AGAR|nr:hypothetical protein D9757_000141 [Collybiopsis confluens]
MSRSDTLETIAVLDEHKGEPASSLPNGFKMFVHPDGSFYFTNTRITVDQDIRDPLHLSAILLAASDLEIDSWDEEIEVQLNITSKGECNMALFINHAHCIAGHSYDEAGSLVISTIDPVQRKVMSAGSSSYLPHCATVNRRRRLYWNFLWTHSAHVPCPPRAVPDACDALTWFYADNLISGPRSVVPFSKSECEELLRRVKDFEASCYAESAAKVAFLAWLLREICSFRNAEMYGELPRKELSDARRNRFHRSKSAASPGPAILHPIIHFIMNFIFFAGIQANWEMYIERLARDYSHFLLISTVLLSATVGILAVPNISRVVEVAAIVSAFSSLGSIIVGVFAIWRHQAKFRTIDSFTYMRNAQHNLLGFHGHAMLLSLPPVLLIWAIISFTISTVAYALGSFTHRNTLDDVAMAVTSFIFVCILGTVLAALYTLSMIWTFTHTDYWWTRLRRKFKKLYLNRPNSAV